jgi:hypothetical protein
MKVSFVIPEETMNAAAAVLAMKSRAPELKAELNEALAKAKQADIVEIPQELLFEENDGDADAMYFAFALAALTVFLKKD